MRVIGGKAGGRRLKAPKGLALRPTADRVKEALFNILPRNLSGYKVLDLYAGTGSLGCEALSRGASEALLIDSAPKARKAIEENLRALKFPARVRVWQIPVARGIRQLSERGERFDLIFLDPPYDRGLVEVTIEAIAKAGVLAAGGLVIAEHSSREKVGASHGPLKLTDQRRYGDTAVSFFGGGEDFTEGEFKTWCEPT